MSDNINAQKLSTIYEYIWPANGDGVYEKLDQSLHPRPPEMFHVVEKLDLNAGSAALDIGCARGEHTRELARRFSFQVKGVDIVDDHIEKAREAVTKQGLAEQVSFTTGSIESIPFEDAAFDLIWCRGVLEQVPSLRQGFRECGRVLKPNGNMVLLTTYATELMETKEAARIYNALGVVSENLSLEYVEDCFKDAGLQILSRETIGSEVAQYYEESDGRFTKQLMRLARMIHAKEKFVAELGQTNYEVTSALYHWGIYRLLGKLGFMIYTLRKTA